MADGWIFVTEGTIGFGRLWPNELGGADQEMPQIHPHIPPRNTAIVTKLHGRMEMDRQAVNCKEEWCIAAIRPETPATTGGSGRE